MRAFELMESSGVLNITSPEEMIELIKRDCQPWLNANKGEEGVIYRGMDRFGEYYKLPVRKNREPRDSAQQYHDILTDIIARKGLEANRTNSVFCTTKFSEVFTYGSPFVIVPIGEFKFTWNTRYLDAFNAAEENADEIVTSITDEEYKKAADVYYQGTTLEVELLSGALNLFVPPRMDQLIRALEQITPEGKSQEVRHFVHYKDDYDYNSPKWLSDLGESNPRLLKDLIESSSFEKDFTIFYQNYMKQHKIKTLNDPDKIKHIKKQLCKYKFRHGQLEPNKVEKFIGNYFTDQNLNAAMDSGFEIMLKCDSYYAINGVTDPDENSEDKGEFLKHPVIQFLLRGKL